MSILTVTFSYFLVSNIPEGFTKIDLFFFEVGSFGFPDISHLVFHIKMKLLIIFLSSIWYITCSHWWKSAILLIIIIELFKLITSMDPESSHMDEIDYITSLPVTAPIIFLLIFISNKLNSYNLYKELQLYIDDEIDEIFFELYDVENKRIEILKRKYEEMIKNGLEKDSSDYLRKLILIRNEFYKD
ncbi:hypothetical protein [Winogradskyella sp. R77965]|uniref:hypothetical protein n=1 Tax=Winogradskyella sp. R77965 TaxID=3093872 RepID=UPI0037DD8F69